MDTGLFSTIVVLLVVVAIAAMVGHRLYSVIFTVLNHVAGDFFNRHLLFKDLQPEYKKVLAARSDYFQKLPAGQKRLFERRVQKFIDLKAFIPRGGLIEVTPEMKVMVAAAAVKITQGFPRVYFQHFQRILIYPDDYYSKINHRYHQGEVHSKGLILLSWKSFERGIDDPADGINLGLHEMAHALKIENRIANNDYLYLDPQIMDQIRHEAAVLIDRIRNGEETFFRKGAGVDFHEFFAVAVENFFERPSLFQHHHRNLFALMRGLLRQTPPFR